VKIIATIFAIFLITSMMMMMTTTSKVDTFVEENNLWYGPEDKSNPQMTEEIFDHVIGRVEQIYAPIIRYRGFAFTLYRDWNSGTVNASARRWSGGNVWEIYMYGGMARHPSMTPDGLALVLCHEFGHHLGGAPLITVWPRKVLWASNEGQSDYFSALKCMKRVFASDDNVSLMSSAVIDPTADRKCDNFHADEQDRALCKRISMAAMAVVGVFKDVANDRNRVSFSTPSKKKVRKTNHKHPAPQCRLDSYFAGALCDKDYLEDVSDEDVTRGVCVAAEGEDGNNNTNAAAKPRCWYRPE